MARLSEIALVAVVCTALLLQSASAYSFNFGGGECKVYVCLTLNDTAMQAL